jgi:type IV secretory pathway TrbD component
VIVTVHSFQAEVTSRGARMLRTALGPDIAAWLEDSAIVEVILTRTLAAAFGLGRRLWLAGLLLWLIGHALAVWAAKRDPLFIDMVRRHLRIPGSSRV